MAEKDKNIRHPSDGGKLKSLWKFSYGGKFENSKT
jgi:hypothetical protein